MSRINPSSFVPIRVDSWADLFLGCCYLTRSRGRLVCSNRSIAMSSPAKLSPTDIDRELAQLPGWQSAGDAIRKTFSFENYYQAMAFVNAVAYIAHTADHHPDMEVGYNKVTVKYSTHDAGGVTELDLQCAQAVNDLE